LDHPCVCRDHGHIGYLCFDAICFVAVAACESDGLYLSHAQLGLGLVDCFGPCSTAGSDLNWRCIECYSACDFTERRPKAAADVTAGA